MIGSTISHYKILEKLGEGGMGVVYKAQDTKLNRPVALKFLPAHLSASEQDKARLLHEARAAASLNHPNICTVYGIDEHEGQNFIAMELVEGKTLRAMLHSLSAKQTLEISVQIAEGLAAAHEKGIMHRDIKPENIMIRKDGIAIIMDFGLAKLRFSSAPRLTLPGNAVGTAGYMSPEQVHGEEVDFRSDIFSLGILLYELFAGQPPFKGTHSAALAYEIVSVDPPSISSIKAEIAPEIDRIVMECLQKDPKDRFQSSAEVAKELRRARRSSELPRGNAPLNIQKENANIETVSHRSSLSPDNRWFGRIALVAIGVGMSGVALLLWQPWETVHSPAGIAVRFSISLPMGCTLELRRNGLALSPDGKHLALIARQDSSSCLFIRDMDQLDIKQVSSTAGLDISGVFFSPDGQWLGFFANGKLMKLSLRGGTPVTICDALGGNIASSGEASWGEGGDIVFMKTWGDRLWIVSSEVGSTARPLTTINVQNGERAHFLPRILPGGKEALFSIWRGGNFDENRIAAVNLNTGEHHTVLNGGTGGTYVRTGHLIYMLGSTMTAAPFDVKNLKVTGEATPVLERVLMNGGSAYPYFSVSDNGTIAFAPGEIEFVPTTITLAEHGSTIRRIEYENAKIGFPLFSPDGNSLAVIIFGPTFQIGSFDLRKNTLMPLTFSGDNIRAAWVADGSRISYSSNVDGRYTIYTVAADGSSVPRKLFDSDANPYPSSWTHDSKNLAYVVAGKETGFDIWLCSSTTTPVTRPLIATRANEVGPAFSPNDHWIAFASDESGQDEVYVQPFPSLTGRWRVSTGGGIAPEWSPDGRRILFQRNDEIISAPVTATAGKNGETLTVDKEERVLVRKGLITFDLSPNGKTIAAGQTKSESLVDHVNIVVNWSAELKNRFSSKLSTAVR